ncbi:MAG TPA: hypothetical protein VEH56_04375 [Candidatus Saccharimonadales bacterium]|nr:hypothetical protein [Candidatus Saccharimonadales bacterium]
MIHRSAVTLVIVGGVLGFFFGAISFLSAPMMGNALGPGYGVVLQFASLLGRYGLIGYPELGIRLNEIMTFWSLISLTGATLALIGGYMGARSLKSRADLVALLGGILLLLTFSWLPALLVIAAVLSLIL